jgi:hypothetical protein
MDPSLIRDLSKKICINKAYDLLANPAGQSHAR